MGFYCGQQLVEFGNLMRPSKYFLILEKPEQNQIRSKLKIKTSECRH